MSTQKQEPQHSKPLSSHSGCCCPFISCFLFNNLLSYLYLQAAASCSIIFFFSRNIYVVLCLFFFNFYFVVVLHYSCLHFSPHLSTPPKTKPTSLECFHHPHGVVHVSFTVVPENPSPHYPFPPPLCLCQIVLNFNVSDYILFAFFFC